ncbi:hypothetical protein HanIR_Chr16g0802331 [Helianthus annuus]|nr:hypothetical protein HanIR_Chr16g0802331 [Helianthus annuus]
MEKHSLRLISDEINAIKDREDAWADSCHQINRPPRQSFSGRLGPLLHIIKYHCVISYWYMTR